MTDREGNEWKTAVDLLDRWERGDAHLDDLLDGSNLTWSRWLVMEVFRNGPWLDHLLGQHLRRPPRPRARHLLLLALAECADREPEKYPRIVHHAVETGRQLKLSRAETGFLNAVLRKILKGSEALRPADPAQAHPAWLARRWQAAFGMEAAHKLMEWNQMPPELHLRAAERPDYAKDTSWPGYYTVERGRFAECLADLQAGEVYMQDPFARIPVELMDPRPGETVFDLCAAPGGKTLLMAEAMQGEGVLLAVDRPGPRSRRLEANLRDAGAAWVKLLAAPIEAMESGKVRDLAGSSRADAIMLDVPCSNSGVIRKRPDVKLRLSEASIKEHAIQQLNLLAGASRWVRPGGRLVYSTCSIEPEENRGVVDAFLELANGWDLQKEVMSYPWECGHDGGGAFLLTRLVSGKK